MLVFNHHQTRKSFECSRQASFGVDFDQRIFLSVDIEFHQACFVQRAVQHCHHFLMSNIWSVNLGILVVLSHDVDMIVTIQQLKISSFRFHSLEGSKVQYHDNDTFC